MSLIANPVVPRHWLAILLMVASGFAGLGYQIIWTEEFSMCLGSDAASVLAVVTAFFAGIAVGALAFGSRVERSPTPQRWYAVAEALTGSWSLLLALSARPIATAVLQATGPNPSPVWQWSIAFASTFLILLPATAAMGVTIPAMERAVAAPIRARRSIAGLYAANTLGAVIGVLAIALYLIPHVGLLRASFFCIAFNILAAFVALTLRAPSCISYKPTASKISGGATTLLRLAATGFLGIGYEILVVRVLCEVTENTVYTFSLVLALYLVGTSLGALIYRQTRPRWRDDAPLRHWLLTLLGLACLTSTALLYSSEKVSIWIQSLGGGGFALALASETTLAMLAFALPTPLMGALFSHLCDESQRAGVTFGHSTGVNTLGAALAPVVFGVFVLPTIGPKFALVAVCSGYVLLGMGNLKHAPGTWLALAGCVALAVFAPPLAFIDAPDGARVVSYRDGIMASVSVVEDDEGVSRLRINNRQQEGANASRRVDGRQALLPMLLHPAPRHALFLGIGAGNTAATAAEEAGVEIDAVELLPEVIEAAELFTAAFPPDVHSRLHFIAADARRYVKTAERRYDVIVADNFHPARSGTSALYTAEHFAAVRTRLSPGGLFCQWLPLHQLDLASLKSIVKSFLIAYPHGYALLASNSLTTPTVGLIGFADKYRFNRASLAARIGAYGTPERRIEFGVEDEFALLGGFIAGPEALTRFAANAPANTDDRPVVAYGAPRLTYAPDSTPAERLIELLNAVSLSPDELVDPGRDDAWATRIKAYWTARDRFVSAGRTVRPTADASAMLNEVQTTLLNVLRISPEFRPAYDPLLRLAIAVMDTDADRGRLILGELATLQPARLEAIRLLSQAAN